jgi:hypothetical protein
MELRNISGPEATQLFTPVSAESMKIALILVSIVTVIRRHLFN